MALNNNVICIKTGSTFNTNRAEHHNICAYHNVKDRNEIINKDTLIGWLENGFICKNTINFIKVKMNDM